MMRKAIYFGLGVISLSREKAEKIYHEMVEKGEMSKDEARKLEESETLELQTPKLEFADPWCSNRFEPGCKSHPYCKMEDGLCPVYNTN
jgi:hypothetical protein